jgi:hypothetical protein
MKPYLDIELLRLLPIRFEFFCIHMGSALTGKLCHAEDQYKGKIHQ